jgi:hypothetical protein
MKKQMASALLIAACSTSDAEKPLPPDPAMVACDEASDEAVVVDAVEDRTAAAPEVPFDGPPHRVRLPAGAAGYVRVVTTDPETPAILFLGAPDVVAGLYFGDGELALVSAGANRFCEDTIPEHFDADLEEPGTYYVALGPTADDTAWILLRHGDGHGDTHAE